MDLEATHIMLVKGKDRKTCRRRVLRFFEKNILVRYDRVNIGDDNFFQAGTEKFWDLVREGADCNRCVVEGLVRDLQEEGFRHVEDLGGMEQGYTSKVLHVLTHMLDGFFGIDTCFYNLEEDSHWLSDELAATIRKQPGDYWLLRAECSSESGTTDFLGRLRGGGIDPD